MRRWALVVMVPLVMAGCSRKTVGVPIYIHDTVAKVREVHDSVSVDKWHTIIVSGDTVRVTDSVMVERWRVTHDTVREVSEVPVEVEVVKEVAKPLTLWQRTKQGGFWVLLLLVGVLFAAQRLRK